MSRYTPDDIARLGPEAQRQIANVRFGIDEQQRQKDALAELRGKRSKYRNERFQADGVWWDSKAEYRRWCELRLMHRAGRITCLIRQPEFPITVNGCRIASYFADFEYYCDGVRIIEDLKSPVTRRNPVYRLKKKLCEVIHSISITEVGGS